MVPVIAYIRVSHVGSRAGDSFISPELQRESIARVCKREGLKVILEIEELDASGGDATRPGWLEAIGQVETGRAKGVVVWNLSRFSRSVTDALRAIERIEAAGGKLYSEEGNLDKLSRTIRLAIAEDERDRAKAGFRSAAANAIQRGIYIAGKIPFGYKRDADRRLVPDVTAPIVVELFERRAKGQSWAELSKWALDTHGRYFARETLRTMILNPAYRGHAYYGDIVNEKAHEPLVSKLLWDKAQAASGSKPVATGRSKNLLLRGIATCESCGHKLVINNSRGANKEVFSIYHCRNLACSDHTSIRADHLDTYVTSSILEFLSSADASLKTKKADAEEMAQAEKELEEATYALDTFKANKKAIVTLGVESWNELLEDYVVARDVAQTQVESLREQAPVQDWNLIVQVTGPRFSVQLL